MKARIEISENAILQYSSYFTKHIKEGKLYAWTLFVKHESLIILATCGWHWLGGWHPWLVCGLMQIAYALLCWPIPYKHAGRCIARHYIKAMKGNTFPYTVEIADDAISGNIIVSCPGGTYTYSVEKDSSARVAMFGNLYVVQFGTAMVVPIVEGSLSVEDNGSSVETPVGKIVQQIQAAGYTLAEIREHRT